LADLGVGGRITRKWNSHTMLWCRLDSTDSGQDLLADTWQHGNEPSGSIKYKLKAFDKVLVRMSKSNRMRWTEHVEDTEKSEIHTKL
jgi:hypothetical protein